MQPITSSSPTPKMNLLSPQMGSENTCSPVEPVLNINREPRAAPPTFSETGC